MTNNTIQVLDPQHKLEYFEKAGWQQEWIDAACVTICDEYDHMYASREVDDPVKIPKVHYVIMIQCLLY